MSSRWKYSARRALTTTTVLFGIATFWFAVFFEYSPVWEIVYDNEQVYINLLWALAAGGLVLAAISASTMESSRHASWPYRHVRVGRFTVTWVGGLFRLLVISSILSWLCLRLIRDFEEVLDPFLPPSPPPPIHRDAEISPPAPPPSPPPGLRARHPWKELLDITSALLGKVSMIPIALLGVPLSRSSGLWRMAGLSYEECVGFHRWLGVLAIVLVTLHSIGFIVLWLWEGWARLVHELFSDYGTSAPDFHQRLR